MARPIRKKLKFDEYSLNNLLQEIYNDTHNIRAKISRLFTKWESKVKENGEVAAIGEQVIKLIAAEAKNQDQKIMLLRYLKEVVYEKNRTSDKDTTEKEDMTDERRSELMRMVEESIRQKKK
jgi:membrane-bound lytic murein transglycosylase